MTENLFLVGMLLNLNTNCSNILTNCSSTVLAVLTGLTLFTILTVGLCTVGCDWSVGFAGWYPTLPGNGTPWEWWADTQNWPKY